MANSFEEPAPAHSVKVEVQLDRCRNRSHADQWYVDFTYETICPICGKCWQTGAQDSMDLVKTLTERGYTYQLARAAVGAAEKSLGFSSPYTPKQVFAILQNVKALYPILSRAEPSK